MTDKTSRGCCKSTSAKEEIHKSLNLVVRVRYFTSKQIFSKYFLNIQARLNARKKEKELCEPASSGEVFYVLAVLTTIHSLDTLNRMVSVFNQWLLFLL